MHSDRESFALVVVHTVTVTSATVSDLTPLELCVIQLTSANVYFMINVLYNYKNKIVYLMLSMI